MPREPQKLLTNIISKKKTILSDKDRMNRFIILNMIDSIKHGIQSFTFECAMSFFGSYFFYIKSPLINPISLSINKIKLLLNTKLTIKIQFYLVSVSCLINITLNEIRITKIIILLVYELLSKKCSVFSSCCRNLIFKLWKIDMYEGLCIIYSKHFVKRKLFYWHFRRKNLLIIIVSIKNGNTYISIQWKFQFSAIIF
jgi:hypothetical protein